MCYSKLKRIIVIAVTVVLFCTAAAVFCVPVGGADDISSISVVLIDNTLDRSDLKTGYIWNDSAQNYDKYSYYDVYDLSNIKLTVKYQSGGSKTFTGNEIAQYSAQTMTAFSIIDNQRETAWGTGKHTVKYRLGGYSTSAVYTVVADEITAVSVKPMYEIAPVFELDGQKGTAIASDGSIYQRFVYDLGKYDYNITVTYSSGKQVSCTDRQLYDLTGYTPEFYQPEGILKAGSYTGYCKVGGAVGTFSFTVKENDVKYVELYMSDNANVLLCPEDGFYTTNSSGKTYFRYLYNRAKIRAKVIYKNGKTVDYSIGELNAALHSRLELYDTQDISPWTSLGAVEVKGRVRGVDCVLHLSLGLGAVQLKTAARSATTLTLSWERNMFADGYELEQYVDGKWKNIATITSESTTSYKISGLTAVTPYSFRIRSYIRGGKVHSAYSTLDTATSPTALTGLAVGGRASDAIRLNWTKNTSADGYIIEQYSSDKWTHIANITDNTVTTYRISGLSPSTTYNFRVQAYKNIGGEAVKNAYVSISAATNPTAVSGLNIGGRAPDAIRLNWNANKTASGYIIEQYIDGKWVRISKITNNAVTTCRISGLAPSTAYEFRIQAYKNISGGAVKSGYATISGETSPTAVVGLKVGQRTSSSLSLVWNKNETASGYIVEQYKDGKWERVAKLTSNTETVYNAENPGSNVVYRFRVQAYKYINGTAVKSAYSELSAAINPQSVEGLEIGEKSSSAIRLNWKKTEAVDGYIIEQYKSGKWVSVAKITSNEVTTYRIGSLSPSTAYKFRIQTYNNTVSGELKSGYSVISAATNPTAVSGFKIGGTAANALRLCWTKNDTADGYIIEQYKSGKWVRIAKLTNNNITYLRVENLSQATVHKFRIQAYKYIGGGAVKSGYKYVSAATDPEAVSGLRVGGRASNALRFNWTENKAASGYIIERYIDGRWVRIAKLTDKSVTTYRATKLSPSTTYKFRIQAYKNTSVGAVKSRYKVITFSTTPTAVTNFKVSGRTADSIRLSWSKNATASGYIIEQYKDGKWTRIAKLKRNTASAYTVTGLDKNAVYKFRIQAYKYINGGATKSVYSSLSAAISPRAVTELKISGKTFDTITLSWQGNSLSDGYIIEQYKSRKWVRVAKLTDNSINAFKAENLLPSNEYKFRVQSYNYVGSGALKSEYVTISAATKPTSVSGLKIGGRASDAIRLNWTENKTATGYIIEQYSDGKWVRIAMLTDNKTVTYRAENLLPSTAYKFRIQAYKNIGGGYVKSAYAAISAATKPTVVTDFKASVIASDSVSLSWSSNTTATGYIIEQYKDGKWVRIAKLTDNAAVTYTIDGLEEDTAYKFRIRTYKLFGKTALYSGYAEISGTTLQ